MGEDDLHLQDPDVLVVTSGRRRIPAHSHILASASPVLAAVLKKKSMRKLIAVPGVPCDAVSAFVRFLYSSRFSGDEVEKYGMHLIVLSHVYAIPAMKRDCIRAVVKGLKAENVIDFLQLARLCDAPNLYLSCMKLISACFRAVERTEGWRFVRDNDPWLELEILQFIDDAESRKKKAKRCQHDRRIFIDLSEAMVCLEHVCGKQPSRVGDFGRDTYRGVVALLRHFQACRASGCGRCRRMLQVLRLHACLCDSSDSCMVPLCREFKSKMILQHDRRDDVWSILVKKVTSAKALVLISHHGFR